DVQTGKCPPECAPASIITTGDVLSSPHEEADYRQLLPLDGEGSQHPDAERPSMSDKLRVQGLLAKWEGGRRAGRPLRPEEVCHDCPELLPEFLAELRRHLQAMHAAAHPSVAVPEPPAPAATNAARLTQPQAQPETLPQMPSPAPQLA